MNNTRLFSKLNRINRKINSYSKEYYTNDLHLLDSTTSQELEDAISLIISENHKDIKSSCKTIDDFIIYFKNAYNDEYDTELFDKLSDIAIDKDNVDEFIYQMYTKMNENNEIDNQYKLNLKNS